MPTELTSCLGDLQFVEDYSTIDDTKIDILLGLGAYWKFVKPDIITFPGSLLATQPTMFGWMLYDSVSRRQDLSNSVLGFMGNPSYSDQKLRYPVLQIVLENLAMVDDRYEVLLPWKPGAQERLLSNEKLAR